MYCCWYICIRSNTTANDNTAVGAYAFDANTTGAKALVLDMHALSNGTTAIIMLLLVIKMH